KQKLKTSNQPLHLIFPFNHHSSRKTFEPFVLPSHPHVVIPAGVQLVTFIYGLHRDPRYWNEKLKEPLASPDLHRQGILLRRRRHHRPRRVWPVPLRAQGERAGEWRYDRVETDLIKRGLQELRNLLLATRSLRTTYKFECRDLVVLAL
ncbi:hypothetical protein BC936DRAFT_150078, partial [Jimgerdemannia flammicorona]